MLHISHIDSKDNLHFFPLDLGNCKQPSGQRNNAETCKYDYKLPGWVFLVAAQLFKRAGQLYATV